MFCDQRITENITPDFCASRGSERAHLNVGQLCLRRHAAFNTLALLRDHNGEVDRFACFEPTIVDQPVERLVDRYGEADRVGMMMTNTEELETAGEIRSVRVEIRRRSLGEMKTRKFSPPTSIGGAMLTFAN